MTGGVLAQAVKLAAQIIHSNLCILSFLFQFGLPSPAWDAAKTRQEVEETVAWMRRMNAVEAEQAARDAKAAKEFETADLANWHPPYEPIGD